MTLRALIFDVDGTLAETEELHRRAFNDTFAAADMDWFWSPEDYRDLLLTTGGKERMRRFRTIIRAEGPSENEIARLHAAKTRRFGSLLQQLTLRSGVAALIAQARQSGLRIAVATTTSRPNVDALCAACWGREADQVFGVIAAGDEVTAKKPAPDVYELALSRLGLPPEACLAFEDSRNGLDAARAAGLRTIVTPSDYTRHEDFTGASAVLTDLSHFKLEDLLQPAG